jgi:hypothetical protein
MTMNQRPTEGIKTHAAEGGGKQTTTNASRRLLIELL